MIQDKKGNILLLTGISGSGKTTLGKKIQQVWKEKGLKQVELIDGDETRNFLNSELGYSDEDRFLVTKIMAYAAYLLAKNDVNVVFSNIAAKTYVRDFLQKCWGEHTLIFLDADVENCIKNDPRGVYKKALSIEKPLFVGIDILYEKPSNADLVLHSHNESVSESFNKILSLMRSNELI
jgi:adenylylsulfate kinase-like enzyme